MGTFYVQPLTAGTFSLNKVGNPSCITKCIVTIDGSEGTYNFGSPIDIPAELVNLKIYFSVTVTIAGTYNSSNYLQFSSTCNLKIGGSIEDFIGGQAAVQNYQFYKLFCDCTTLVDISELTFGRMGKKTYVYSNMFYGCSNLVSVPESIHIRSFTSNCCYGMFQKCTSLKKAPEIICSSDTASPSCLQNMFYGCTNLIEGPSVLSPLTLGNSCYMSMFYNCSNLIKAPILPATTLATYCYSNMFSGCSKLVEAPELPATTLANYCYAQMFTGCAQLVKPPQLPATTLADGCYQQMFYSCLYGLKILPELPAIDLPASCYSMMFGACSQVKVSKYTSTGKIPFRIPTTGTGSSVSTSLTNMFYNTTGDLKGTPVINTEYYVAKYDALIIYKNIYDAGTVSNSYAVEHGKNATITATPTSKYDFNYWEKEDGSHITDNPYTFTVNEDTTITAVFTKKFMPDPTNDFLCFEMVERGDISFKAIGTLTTLPIIYYSLNKETWFPYSFGYILSLPVGQKVYFAGDNNSFSESTFDYINFDSTGKVKASGNIMSLLDSSCESKIIPTDYCFAGMFYNCTLLIEAPELPATTLTSNCYIAMFEICTSLINAPELPATTLAINCYSWMFIGCTSLKNLPELPATTLPNGCYQSMFSGCHEIKLSSTKVNEYNTPYRIPTTGTGTVGTNSLSSMFSNTGGTFIGTPTINTTYYLAAPIPYSIIVDSEKGQLASDATQPGEYVYNTQIKAHVTAKPHWEFKHYLIKSSNDDIIEDNPYIFNLTNEVELEAIFAPSYLIDITVEGNGATTYTHTDTEITFTTTYEEHNIFIKYVINDISYYDNPLTIPYDQDMNVTTYIDYIGREYTYSAEGEGSIISYDRPPGIYDRGTPIFVEAIPEYRWHFIGWYNSGGALLSEDTEYLFTLETDLHLIGKFEEDSKYHINLTSNIPGNNIWQSDIYVYHGDSVTFRVRDVAGYVFLKWSDDSTEKNRTLTVTSEINLNAIYYKVAEESSGAGGFEWRCFVKSLYNPITHEGINSEVKAMLGVRSFTIANDLLTTANSSIVVYDLPEETIYEGDVLMLYNPQGKPRYYGIIKSISDKTKDNPTVTIQCEQMQSFYKGLWIKETCRTKTTVEEEFAYLLDRYANGYMKGFPSGTRDTLQYYEKAPIKVLSVPGATANLVAPTEATETEDMETYIYSLYEKYQIMLDFYIPFGSWTIGADSPTGATVTVKKFSLAQDENPLTIFDNNNAIMNLSPTTETEENNLLMVYNENGTYRTSYVIKANDDGTVSIEEGFSNIDGRLKDIKKQIVFSDDTLDNIKKENLSTEMFNHHISFSLLIDNNLYKFDDFKLGMPINIYHNGNMYKSVITGMQISKDAGANVLQANFTCGFVRTTLTKKLSRKLGVIK